MQQGVETLGQTCSACHTRQIEVDGKAYRIDGGPAIADIGAFWADPDAAVNHILTDSGAFSDFARAVLGPSPSAAKETALRKEVQNWLSRSTPLWTADCSNCRRTSLGESGASTPSG